MKNILDILIKWLVGTQSVYTGANLPSKEELASTIPFTDIVATLAPVVWYPLDVSKLPSWVQYDQGKKNSCVASTKALMDSIKFYKRNALQREVKFSNDFIYKFRQPLGEGMAGTQAIKITNTIGNLHDALFPACNTDDDIDAIQLDPWMLTEAAIYQTADQPIIPPIKDIDTLVSIMNITDKPIMTWFDFDWHDWKAVPIDSGNPVNSRHSVTFIPPKNKGEMTWGIYEGEKAIVIQDSWGLRYGMDGKRIIKESFFKRRNIFNQYDMKFKFDVSNIGAHYDGSIISLQQCLRQAGFFPTNVSYIESFGPTTKASLLKWKQANGLPADSILDDVTKALLKINF